MSNRKPLAAAKRRILKTVSATAPLISGIIWGGFWVRAMGGIEDIHAGVAGILIAFAVGRLFSRLPGSSLGRLGFWYVACSCYLEHHLLLPVAFYFGLTETLRRRNRAGRFVCGLISGVLLGWRFDFAAISLLAAGVVLFFAANREERKKSTAGKFRIVTGWVFNCVAVALVMLLEFYPEPLNKFVKKKNEHHLAPVTLISSVGLSEKSAPQVLLISRRQPVFDSVLEQILADRIHLLLPGKRTGRKYDVVIAEYLPAAMRLPGRISDLLAPGGVLVMPVDLCYLLPELHWRTLPGRGDGGFCAAAPDRKAPLIINGEVVEKNLRKIIRSDKIFSESPIPDGTISGAMVDFDSVEPSFEDHPMRPDGNSRILWGAVLLLILLESFLHNRKIGEYMPPVISAVIFGLTAAVLTGSNEMCEIVDGEMVLFAAAVLPLWLRLPFKDRFLRVISVLSAVALGIWWFYPGTLLALPALILAVLIFSGCRSRFQSENAASAMWQDFFTLLALAGAFRFGGAMHNETMNLLLAILSLKLWLQLRS